MKLLLQENARGEGLRAPFPVKEETLGGFRGLYTTQAATLTS